MQQDTILRTTRNLIKLYCHLPGETEVPRVYHTWACISLIAACVEGRVWYEKHPGKKLLPHLYVFLIGPPALGKGIAIDMAFDFFLRCNGGGHFWHGSTTAANFKDVLGKTGTDERGRTYIPSPKIWLVTDEMADDIGRGQLADDFIKLMTKLYTSTGTIINTGTRKDGHVTIIDPVVNWLAGSTEDWYLEAVAKNIIKGGFSSRVVHVFATYHARRLTRPRPPWDYEMVRDHILTRLWLLSQIEGQFVMTDEAKKREDTWYMNRPTPKDMDLYPNWKREQDQVIKLAMLLALADGGPLIIEDHHLARAVRLSAMVQANIPKVVELANKDPQMAAMLKVEEVIRQRGRNVWVPYEDLLDFCQLKGIGVHKLRKMLQEWMLAECVELGKAVGRTGRQVKAYRWIKWGEE